MRWKNGLHLIWLTTLMSLPVLDIRLPAGTTLPAALLLSTAFLLLCLFPYRGIEPSRRLRSLVGGIRLLDLSGLSALLHLVLTIFYCLSPTVQLSPGRLATYILLWCLLCCLLTGSGLLRLFLSSRQLGIKWRLLLLLLWWFPVVNLLLFRQVVRIVRLEYRTEWERAMLNAARQERDICKTRYPLVLIHGVFFRDRAWFNYWGRIPAELIRNGATVFYGEQQSASSNAAAAEELAQRIRRILRETGCEKVNLIAHSKGGLEARWAISRLGLAPYVASLTTINTPHRGCAYADWLLARTPKMVQNWLTRRYNGAMRRLGDQNPDFFEAVSDLTEARCRALNEAAPNIPGVYYRSIGSYMTGWRSAPFPQNLSYLLVRHFSRRNDGLVGVDSMRWGDFRLLSPPGRHGISHGDMIDLNRRDIPHFDVRAFYVELVRELRNRGF